MAAAMTARHDKHPTISFTLPISCQICLGKVKQPVLCCNNHVFCSSCMGTWLERNQKCPACRTTIDANNPVKQIRGGLNQAEENNDNMSNPQLRRARFELLYKEYEDEFDRLESEAKLLRTENEILKGKNKSGSGKSDSGFRHPDSVDTNSLLALTKKLQDAQKLYERLKSDMAKVKEENHKLKDENVNLNRENEKIRLEIVGRSPQRYGRTTVATLESKCESYEKEIHQLNKALERSDKYVEDLENEVSKLRGTKPSSSVTSKASTRYERMDDQFDSYGGLSDSSAKRQLFGRSSSDIESRGSSNHASEYVRFYPNTLENGAVNSRSISHKPPAGDQKDVPASNLAKGRARSVSPSKEKSPKKVHFSLPKGTESSSFDLEQPSPMTPSSSLGKLSLSSGSPTTPSGTLAKLSLANGRASPSDIDSRYFDSSRYSAGYSKSRSGLSMDTDVPVNGYDFEYKRDSSLGRESSGTSQLSVPEFEATPTKSTRNKHGLEISDLDDTQTIRSELDDLNISLTPELSDCMKLLNRAEKKSHSGETAGSRALEQGGRPVDMFSSSSSQPISSAGYPSYKPYSDIPMSSWEHEYYSKVQGNPYKAQVVPRTEGISVGYSSKEMSDFGLSHVGTFFPSYTSSSIPTSYSVPSSSAMYALSSQSGSAEGAKELDNKLFMLGIAGDKHKSTGLSDSLPPRSDSHVRSSYSSSSKRPPLSFHASLPITTTAQSFPRDLLASSLSSRNPTTRRSSLDFGTDLDSLKTTGQNLLASQTIGRKFSSLTNIPAAIPSSNSYGASGGSHLQRLSQLIPVTSSFDLSFKPSNYSMPYAVSSNSSVLSLTGGITAASTIPSSYTVSSMSRSSTVLPASSSLLSAASAAAASSVSLPASSYPTSSASYTSSSYRSSSSSKPSTYDGLEYPSSSGDHSRKGNYSYISNASNEQSTQGSDAFLSEPKKRLFESGDDFDLTLSPIKSTRIN